MDRTLVGRIWDPTLGGPSVITDWQGWPIDITCRTGPLVRDICEMDSPAKLAARGLI